MENVTRDVIADLWPLYGSGDASPDTRALVEAFLGRDPQFAQTLRESAGPAFPQAAVPSLTPDHELKTLQRIKRRLSGPIWIMQAALIFSCLAFGRLVSDTSFDVSPRVFIVTATIALGFWVAFLIRLLKLRREVLVIRLRR